MRTAPPPTVDDVCRVGVIGRRMRGRARGVLRAALARHWLLIPPGERAKSRLWLYAAWEDWCAFAGQTMVVANIARRGGYVLYRTYGGTGVSGEGLRQLARAYSGAHAGARDDPPATSPTGGIVVCRPDDVETLAALTWDVIAEHVEQTPA